MTSIDYEYILIMEKALAKIIFGCKICISHPIFKNFVALFKLLECKRMAISYFAGDVSEEDDMQKGSFQRMV